MEGINGFKSEIETIKIDGSAMVKFVSKICCELYSTVAVFAVLTGLLTAAVHLRNREKGQISVTRSPQLFSLLDDSLDKGQLVTPVTHE